MDLQLVRLCVPADCGWARHIHANPAWRCVLHGLPGISIWTSLCNCLRDVGHTHRVHHPVHPVTSKNGEINERNQQKRLPVYQVPLHGIYGPSVFLSDRLALGFFFQLPLGTAYKGVPYLSRQGQSPGIQNAFDTGGIHRRHNQQSGRSLCNNGYHNLGLFFRRLGAG